MNPILSLIIPALIIVESGGDNFAIGDHGEAVGCLQIHACVIEDVNRVSKTKYTLEDRLDRDKSIEICYRYLWHYGTHYKRTTGEEPTAEILSRIWNGGPKGYAKDATAKYWAKVKREMDRMKRDTGDYRGRIVKTSSEYQGERRYSIKPREE